MSLADSINGFKTAYFNGNNNYKSDCPFDETVGNYEDSASNFFASSKRTVNPNSFESALFAASKFEDSKDDSKFNSDEDYSFDSDDDFEKEYKITPKYEESDDDSEGFNSES